MALTIRSIRVQRPSSRADAIRFFVTDAVPAIRRTDTHTTPAIFNFVQAMNFIAPWISVKVAPLAVAPFARPIAVADFASAAGAAFTELAAIAAVNAATG